MLTCKGIWVMCAIICRWPLNITFRPLKSFCFWHFCFLFYLYLINLIIYNWVMIFVINYFGKNNMGEKSQSFLLTLNKTIWIGSCPNVCWMDHGWPAERTTENQIQSIAPESTKHLLVISYYFSIIDCLFKLFLIWICKYGV